MWWIIAALILAGIILLLAELLLIPGIGIAGFLSIGSFIAACWYAFSSFGTAVGWTVTGLIVILIVASLLIILRSKTWEKLELKTEVTSKMNSEVDKVKVGDRGIAKTRLAPMGTGKFGTLTCEVKSHDNSMVSAGTQVEVVEITDNQVIVKPITNE